MALPVELSLEDYWRILRRRSWLIFFAFSVTVLFTAAYSFYQRPVFASSATMKIEMPPGTMEMMYDPFAGLTTQLQVILGASVAEKALRITGKITEKTPNSDLGGLIASAMGRINAKQIGATTLVSVTGEAFEPQEAADLANAVVTAYIELDRQTRQESNQQALKNIIQRKDQIGELLYKLEEDKKHQAENAPTGAIGASGLAGQLLNLETQKKVLLDLYTEEHPEVTKLTKQMEVLNRQLRSMPEQGMEIARLERDLRIQEQIYTNLAKEYEEQKVASSMVISLGSLVSSAKPNRVPVRPNRKANITFGAILGLVLGLVLSFLSENIDTSLQTVEDVEKALGMPVLGLIPHIAMSGEGEESYFLKWFRMGKHESTENIRRRMVIHMKPQSPAVEAYHSLRANIESHLDAEGGRSLLFTSSGIGEGKSISCMNFALAAVQSGVRVLLIDGDLRRPSLHRMLGVPNDLGLSDVVVGGKPLESVLKSAADFMVGSAQMADPLKARGIENLYLLTAGSSKVSPTEFLKQKGFTDLLKKVSTEYDWVIFDCPPLLLFADGLLVGPLVKGVVLFYQAGRMARSALKRAKDELLTVKARPLGIVLNDVRPKELEPRYGYYRSAEYYDYYTRDEDKSAEEKTP